MATDASLGERLCTAAHEKVVERFLADRHLEQYAELLGAMLGH